MTTKMHKKKKKITEKKDKIRSTNVSGVGGGGWYSDLLVEQVKKIARVCVIYWSVKEWSIINGNVLV